MFIPLLALFLLFFSLSSIAAVLFGGAPVIGGSFFSLSPLLDCLLYLLPAVGAGALMLYRRRKYREIGVPPLAVPASLRFPIGYGTAQLSFSILIIALGLLGLFDYTAGVYLPFLLFVLLSAALSLLSGFLSCRLVKGRRADLLWLIPLLLLFMFLLWSRIRTITAEDAHWLAELGNEAVYEPGYTARIMDSLEGALLSRLNIQGSVLLASYEDSYFRGIHSMSREELATLCTLLPPTLFALGWAARAISKKKQ